MSRKYGPYNDISTYLQGEILCYLPFLCADCFLLTGEGSWRILLMAGAFGALTRWEVFGFNALNRKNRDRSSRGWGSEVFPFLFSGHVPGRLGLFMI